MKKMISRRSFLAAAGVSAAALALTACGGSSSSTAASTAASTAGSTAAASGDTIKVGVMGIFFYFKQNECIVFVYFFKLFISYKHEMKVLHP